MTLSRTPKILVGIGTAIVALYPILMIAIAFGFMFLPIYAMEFSGSSQPDLAIFGIFFLIFPVMMLIGFLQFGMMIFYIIAIVKKTRLALTWY